VTAAAETSGPAVRHSAMQSAAAWTDADKEQALKAAAFEPITLAYAVLDLSGITNLVRERTQKPRGRKQVGLSAVDVLAAAIAVPLKNGSPQFHEMARLLHQDMPPAERRRRGITRPWPTAAHTTAQRRNMIRAAEEAVRRRFESLSRAFDTYTGPRNQRMDLDGLVEEARKAQANDPDGALTAARRTELLDVMNGLVHGTLNLVPSDLLAQMGDVFAIDGTFVPTWARGPRQHTPYKKVTRAVNASGGSQEPQTGAPGRVLTALKKPGNSLVAADPEAGWYIRTNADGSTEEKGFGYDAHLAIALNPSADTNTVTFPTMVVGLTLDTPAFDPGPNAVELVERMQQWARDSDRSPFKIGVFDALYPRLKPQDFGRPLRRLGVMPLHRLRNDMLGKSGVSHEGADLVEGTWYCAQMPNRLVNASKELAAGTITESEHGSLVKDRERWEMYRISGDDVLTADGEPKSHRYECPASHRGGGHSCVRKPHAAGPQDLPLPVRALPADAPAPAACSQRTFTIPYSLGTGIEQAEPYFSEAWKDLNGRFRSANEGKNGALKDPAKIGIGAKGRRRVNGLAANGLLLACQVAAANLQRLTTFLESTEPATDGVRTRTYSAYRTRRAEQKAADRPAGQSTGTAPRHKRRLNTSAPVAPRARSARTSH